MRWLNPYPCYFMRMTKPVLISFVFSLSAFCFVLTGCNKEKGLDGLYPVKGKITWKGEVVQGASITLSPASSDGGARSAGATSDTNGEFKIRTLKPDDGAYPGEYTITVRKMVADKTYTDEEYEAANASGVSLPAVNSKNVLPDKYNNVKTSDLKFTVVAGKNADLIIELE